MSWYPAKWHVNDIMMQCKMPCENNVIIPCKMPCKMTPWYLVNCHAKWRHDTLQIAMPNDVMVPCKWRHGALQIAMPNDVMVLTKCLAKWRHNSLQTLVVQVERVWLICFFSDWCARGWRRGQWRGRWCCWWQRWLPETPYQRSQEIELSVTFSSREIR